MEDGLANRRRLREGVRHGCWRRGLAASWPSPRGEEHWWHQGALSLSPSLHLSLSLPHSPGVTVVTGADSQWQNCHHQRLPASVFRDTGRAAWLHCAVGSGPGRRGADLGLPRPLARRASRRHIRRPLGHVGRRQQGNEAGLPLIKENWLRQLVFNTTNTHPLFLSVSLSLSRSLFLAVQATQHAHTRREREKSIPQSTREIQASSSSLSSSSLSTREIVTFACAG